MPFDDERLAAVAAQIVTRERPVPAILEARLCPPPLNGDLWYRIGQLLQWILLGGLTYLLALWALGVRVHDFRSRVS